MKHKTIKKSIEINAPKEKVWEVLLDDKFTRIWYAEFSEGSHAETDWKIGSKALFTDNSKTGIVGKIIENKPSELISIGYEGIVGADGIEDYESDKAMEVKGSYETYTLSQNDEGKTLLSISCDMAENYFDTMSLAWDKALLKIKTLSA
ncbi:MAG: SRPBCC domain-containing protein [Ferruginibacter sp.]|nr:SRPBCC domain-containing protein [Ferruginibacter sp.]